VSESQTMPPGSIAAAISNATVKLMNEYTGRGPTKAKTTISRDLIAVVLQDTMTKAERTLASNGDAQFVIDMRHRFQHAMQDDLVAAVERLSERKVIAFMSDNHIEPDMAVEVFILEPQPETAEN
jgi:uncharacterized protein YbcI